MSIMWLQSADDTCWNNLFKYIGSASAVAEIRKEFLQDLFQ